MPIEMAPAFLAADLMRPLSLVKLRHLQRISYKKFHIPLKGLNKITPVLQYMHIVQNPERCASTNLLGLSLNQARTQKYVFRVLFLGGSKTTVLVLPPLFSSRSHTVSSSSSFRLRWRRLSQGGAEVRHQDQWHGKLDFLVGVGMMLLVLPSTLGLRRGEGGFLAPKRRRVSLRESGEEKCQK